MTGDGATLDAGCLLHMAESCANTHLPSYKVLPALIWKQLCSSEELPVQVEDCPTCHDHYLHGMLSLMLQERILRP
jgi:hypothetical protein